MENSEALFIDLGRAALKQKFTNTLELLIPLTQSQKESFNKLTIRLTMILKLFTTINTHVLPIITFNFGVIR